MIEIRYHTNGQGMESRIGQIEFIQEGLVPNTYIVYFKTLDNSIDYWMLYPYHKTFRKPDFLRIDGVEYTGKDLEVFCQKQIARQEQEKLIRTLEAL